MNPARQLTLFVIILTAFATSVQAKYTETMDPNGPTKDMKSDFGLVDDGAETDQSRLLQRGIDATAARLQAEDD